MSDATEQKQKVEHKVLLRRHINLLSALREQGVLAFAGSDDKWHIQFSRATLPAPAKAEGT